MNHLELLLSEMQRQGITKRDMARAMNWHEDTLIRWDRTTARTNRAWLDDLALCWLHLGYELVPVRMPGMKSRIPNGSSFATNKKPYRCHPIVRVMFEELEARGIRREDLASAVGIHPNTLDNMEAGRSRGKPDIVEACFNVLGMTLKPVRL